MRPPVTVNTKFDILIVGAGPVGCTAARKLAEQGLRIKLIEKRNHIAGNCYDFYDEHGIIIHRYGAHFFHTNNTSVFEFLSRFTDWIDADYIVKCRFKDQLYPVPYVGHQIQKMPREGFTRLFERMLDHENIVVELEKNFEFFKDSVTAYKATLYTGPVDFYFDFELGDLPWRSLHFNFVNKKVKFFQECVCVDETDPNVPHTRVSEIKHVTRQNIESTTICYEIPTPAGDPYYPLPSVEACALYLEYQKLAEAELLAKNVFFAGRLALYAYISIDEAILQGLQVADEMLKVEIPTN